MRRRERSRWSNEDSEIVEARWYTYTSIHTHMYICIYAYIHKHIPTHTRVHSTGTHWAVKLAHYRLPDSHHANFWKNQ